MTVDALRWCLISHVFWSISLDDRSDTINPASDKANTFSRIIFIDYLELVLTATLGISATNGRYSAARPLRSERKASCMSTKLRFPFLRRCVQNCGYAERCALRSLRNGRSAEYLLLVTDISSNAASTSPGYSMIISTSLNPKTKLKF